MNEKLPLIGRGRIRDSFETFVGRKIRERRRLIATPIFQVSQTFAPSLIIFWKLLVDAG
jgi:hypothetical protein